MSEETLFEKLGVKYIEKDGIFYPLITLGGEENSTDVWKIWSYVDGLHTEGISAAIQKSGSIWRIT